MDQHPKTNTEKTLSLPALNRPAPLAPLRPPVVVETQEQGLSPAKVLAALRYWWKLALPVGLALGTTAALVVHSLFTPQYQATYWLRIEDEAPYLAFQEKQASERSEGFVATQIELLRSPMVLAPVVAVPAVNSIPELAEQENLVEWLGRNIVIQSVGESELYTIRFTCSQPKAAADVVNSVVDSYFKLRDSEQRDRIGRVIAILDLEKTAREEDVEKLRKGVRDLAQQITGQDPFNIRPEPVSQETVSLSELRNRLIEMEVEESILQAKVNAFESFDPKSTSLVSDAQIEQVVNSNEQVVLTLQSIADKKAKLKSFAEQAVLGTEDPGYKRAAKVVTEEEQGLTQLKSTLREQARQHLEAAKSGEAATELAKLRAQLEDRRITRELLQERYTTELTSKKQSTGDSVTLRFRQEELGRAERVLDLISERIVQLKTEQSAPQRVWQMERAGIPNAPIKGMPYLNMLLAFMAGLLAPFGLAVAKEQITARVVDADLLERRAKLAVLGEIAQLPTQRRGLARLGVREQRAVCLFEESVDAMRTNLLLSAGSTALRFIAVASAVNEEGKTTVAVQLASSIARATGARTLIIDGDLRDPSIHGVFEVPREPGLTNVLKGEVSLREAIAITRVEGVDVLPAGLLLGSPHALLANGRWETLLKQIPSEYRYVIVDTPPVLAASEALVLVRSVDTVLMCALRDVTRMPQLQKAVARITSTGARLGGLVLNGIPTSHYASRYGTYSYLLER